MGKYINKDTSGNFIGRTFDEKLQNLLKDGAVKISPPAEWEEGLICLVDNFSFAAAGYAYNQRVMKIFLIPGKRKNQWLKFDKAKELAD